MTTLVRSDVNVMSALVLLLVSSAVVAASRITCPNSTVSAREGVNVTLKAEVLPNVDLSGEQVVIRNQHNELVHLYQYYKDYLRAQSSSYKDRTTLNHQDLKRGYVYLTIFNVTLSDSGEYKVFLPGLRLCFVITLSVVNDSSSAEAPVIPTAKPNSGDAALKEGPSTTVIATVSVLAVLAVLVYLLWKTGRLEMLVSRFRGTQGPRDEIHEMESLNHQPERDGDAHNAEE